MKSFVYLVAILYLLPLKIAAEVKGPSSSVLKFKYKNGESQYNTTCVACHGADGKGAIPGIPDFTSLSSPLKKKHYNILIENVKKGFKSKGSPMPMPAKGGNPNLSDEDIKDVIGYLLQRFGFLKKVINEKVASKNGQNIETEEI